jgi:hypothetical protein
MECRKCNVELVVGENITKSQIKYSNYICKPCNKQWNQSDIGKASHKKYTKSNKGKANFNKYYNKKQGVYGIFSGKTCLYVGESSRLSQRMSVHKSYIKKPETSGRHKQLYIRISQHDNVYFKVLEETKNHKEQEIVWIDYMNPLYNTYNE